MHNPSCHHGANTISRMCRAGSGLQGVSLGTGANAQGVQMEFESSPNILLPFFSPGAKILPPNDQAPLLDHAAFPCELSIRRSSRTEPPQTRSLSRLLSSSSTLPSSSNPSYAAPKPHALQLFASQEPVRGAGNGGVEWCEVSPRLCAETTPARIPQKRNPAHPGQGSATDTPERS